MKPLQGPVASPVFTLVPIAYEVILKLPVCVVFAVVAVRTPFTPIDAELESCLARTKNGISNPGVAAVALTVDLPLLRLVEER